MRDELDMIRTVTGVSIFMGFLFLVGGILSGDSTIWYSLSTVSFVLAVLRFRKLHIYSKNIEAREEAFAQFVRDLWQSEQKRPDGPSELHCREATARE